LSLGDREPRARPLDSRFDDLALRHVTFLETGLGQRDEVFIALVDRASALEGVSRQQPLVERTLRFDEALVNDIGNLCLGDGHREVGDLDTALALASEFDRMAVGRHDLVELPGGGRAGHLETVAANRQARVRA
jgi:hypothetical protein